MSDVAPESLAVIGTVNRARRIPGIGASRRALFTVLLGLSVIGLADTPRARRTAEHGHTLPGKNSLGNAPLRIRVPLAPELEAQIRAAIARTPPGIVRLRIGDVDLPGYLEALTGLDVSVNGVNIGSVSFDRHGHPIERQSFILNIGPELQTLATRGALSLDQELDVTLVPYPKGAMPEHMRIPVGAVTVTVPGIKNGSQNP